MMRAHSHSLLPFCPYLFTRNMEASLESLTVHGGGKCKIYCSLESWTVEASLESMTVHGGGLCGILTPTLLRSYPTGTNQDVF